MSLHRATTAALRAMGRRPTVATRSATLLTTSSARTSPIRSYVKESAPRPQASNKDKNEPAHAGSFARTDDSITVEYPEDHELPSSEPVAGAGRAGMHVYPTLATFSLEGKVGVIWLLLI
ncbi:D-arabinitol 2-dehydrogenase [ribulose-forming] [Cytospora mali]|uniref:D-arabinitol 2-dehydrogenase [ribulose-forming] n=1 Tax=Cytospora mali TaxID=578113 RepID=A0A194UR57_CYTMA|nr:D-arabinitol 2-dehydrogenase [ribulose-forming] [Valsa mali var. pyri (nom. inval.)]